MTTSDETDFRTFLPLSALDLQVLLTLSERDLYGYAIMKAVEEASSGVLHPEIGSLYRVLGRLMDHGWVEESQGPEGEGSHRGKPRKYYGITQKGRKVATAEVQRLAKVVRTASSLGRQVAR